MEPTEEKKKATPCPVCQQPLVLQYSKKEPMVRQDPVSGRLRVPMRCPRCGINLEIVVAPEALVPEEDA